MQTQASVDAFRPSPLVYGAIGDAYGFGFEFAPADFVATHNQLKYLGNPYWQTAPGHYSDDTQMQLALAELLLLEQSWTELAVADAFVTTFKRDPRPGYAKRFYGLLQEISSGRELLDRISTPSERNGAAMRAPVLGLLPDKAEVIAKATLQARITHNSPGGVDSAVASALMGHFFTYQLGEKASLPDFLGQDLPGYDWHALWQGEVPCHGISTVQAALTAILSTDNHADLLRHCIAYTGDVDSVATIALAAASGSPAFTRNLTASLWSGLENAAFGRDALREIESRLLNAIGWNTRSAGQAP